MALFKRATAEGFSVCCVDEVSLRRGKSRRGDEGFLTCNLPADEEARVRIDNEVVKCFVHKYKDNEADRLKVSYLPELSWGSFSRCAVSVRVKDVSLPQIRARV